LGLLEFDEGEVAIAEGEASVRMMQPVLERIMAEI
jgi:hypothetical protein